MMTDSKNILSIPGQKSEEKNQSLKQDIQRFVNKLEARKIEYISDNDNKIKIKVELEREFKKSKENETEWYLWNIYIEQAVDVSDDMLA